MHLKVLHHANCFDGCASAAVFSRFFAEREGARLERVVYLPVQHHEGDPFPPGAFDGDVNACVDFRYSPSPGLHWWFDHHASAFVRPQDRSAFESDKSGRKFWDPTAPSCTGFICRILSEHFDWRADDLADLVHWADIIDAARFPSAAMAVRLEEPALRIMAFVESIQDTATTSRLIEAMKRQPLSEIAAEEWVAKPLVPVFERHFRSIETVREMARLVDGVVFIDLTNSGVEGANKFIAYDLFPEARYTVVVSLDPKRAKVSVGSNPWARPPRAHNIARICERYGGGGHPVVGAVSFDPGRIADAQRIAKEIANELSRDPAQP
jgi:hypothetical protein